MEPLFTGEEYETRVVESLRNIKEALETEQVLMVITDVELSDEDGFSVIEQIRRTSPIPIMVLSGRDEEAAKIKAFRNGADDYVVYPCSPLELLARVKAHIRRCKQLSGSPFGAGKVYVAAWG